MISIDFLLYFKVHIGQMTALTTLFPNKSDCVIVNRKKHIAISDVKCTLQTGILCRTRTPQPIYHIVLGAFLFL